MTTEVRVRKVCPSCFSLNVGKCRKNGKYNCKSCGYIFISPALKEVKTHNNIPESLRKIIGKKKQEAVIAGDILEVE
jgi:ribosomal protein L37AE/L43A